MRKQKIKNEEIVGNNLPRLADVICLGREFSSVQMKWLSLFDQACNKIFSGTGYYFNVQRDRITIYPNGSKTKFVTFYINTRSGGMEFSALDKHVAVNKLNLELNLELNTAKINEYFRVYAHPSINNNFLINVLNSIDESYFDNPDFVNIFEGLVKQSYCFKFKLDRRYV